jgi:hypothetical protein
MIPEIGKIPFSVKSAVNYFYVVKRICFPQLAQNKAEAESDPKEL